MSMNNSLGIITFPHPASRLNRLVFVGLCTLVALSAYGSGDQSQLQINTAQCQCRFQVEVAATAEQRRQGLMYRTQLGADQGMLFVYPQPKVVTMWMKNTYLSLDMLFINSQGVITHSVEHTTPLSEARISSRGAVKAVLELPAGSIESRKIKTGLLVEHPVFDD